MQRHDVCFEHAQSVWRSVYWRCQSVAAMMLAMVLNAPQRSAFFLDAMRMLLWCGRVLIIQTSKSMTVIIGWQYVKVVNHLIKHGLLLKNFLINMQIFILRKYY